MQIAILDDNEGFLATGLLVLEQAGDQVAKFTDPGQFLAFMLVADAPVIAFVDHDLGREEVGYDIVRRIRQSRLDGLIVPLVYLTGRETEQGFLAAEADDPYAAPSLYLNKRALIVTDLEELVARLTKQYEDARELTRTQAVRDAMDFFEHLPDENIVER